MKKIILAAVVLTVSVFLAGHGFSAEKASTAKTNPVKAILGVPAKVVEPIVNPAKSATDTKAKSAEKEEVLKTPEQMTQSELSSRIKEELTNNEEIAKFIPEVKKEQNKDGSLSFTYNGTNIESLDKKTLEKLFGRVRNEGVRIRTERLNRQMQNLRRIQEASRIGRTGNVTGSPHITKPPKIYSAPKVPNIPKTNVTPKVPKIPKPYTSR